MHHSLWYKSYNSFFFTSSRSRGPGGGMDPGENKMFYGMMTGVTIAAIIGLYSGSYKEITWREFLNQYLNRNVVSVCPVIVHM